jgi:hypothetical protein
MIVIVIKVVVIVVVIVFIIVLVNTFRQRTSCGGPVGSVYTTPRVSVSVSVSVSLMIIEAVIYVIIGMAVISTCGPHP